MIVSSNELQVTVLKACVGAHVPRGIADEVSKGVVLLAVNGREPVASLVDALNACEVDAVDPDWQKQPNGWQARSILVLHHGPAAVDFALLEAGQGEVQIGNLDHPLLLEGMAMVTGCQFVLASNGAQTVLKFKSASPQSQQATLHDLSVDDASWKKLHKLAEEILVPADDTNRADAGAGLTDND